MNRIVFSIALIVVAIACLWYGSRDDDGRGDKL